jgi:hypothetical protein
MNLELSVPEGNLLKRVLPSFLSELRLEIRETKGDKTSLREEELLVKGLMEKISELIPEK